MAKSTATRLYNAAVRALRRRDRLEMRLMNALLQKVAPLGGRTRQRHVRRSQRPAPPWRGFRSVLCPVDFSEHSRYALRHAEAVARRGHARLTVLYVNDPLLIAAAAVALHDQTLARRTERELAAFTRAALSRVPRGRLHLKTVVATGSPAAEIMKAARRAGCDLIVLGTQGLSGTERMLMGSTTATILARTTIPVLAVPRRRLTLTPHERRDWPAGPIVAALELGRETGNDAARATRIAQRFGASLLLVHVVPEAPVPGWMTATRDYRKRDRARLSRAEEWLAALATVARRHVPTDISATCGNVADEITSSATRSGAGLIVTTLRDRRYGARRGDVSYELLLNAVTPVLACPPRWHRM